MPGKVINDSDMPVGVRWGGGVIAQKSRYDPRVMMRTLAQVLTEEYAKHVSTKPSV